MPANVAAKILASETHTKTGTGRGAGLPPPAGAEDEGVRSAPRGDLVEHAAVGEVRLLRILPAAERVIYGDERDVREFRRVAREHRGVARAVVMLGRKLLREVGLFDVYEGDKLPEGKKSYALSFILQDEERTLTDDQVEKAMGRIRQALEKETGALLRG